MPKIVHILSQRQGRLGAYAEAMENDAKLCLSQASSALGLSSSHELSLLLCDNPTIHRLNRRWRQVDRPTDVLSFPLHELRAGQPPPMGALGDIVVSLPTARLAARREGVSDQQHLQRLLIHGLLHLLGYDHENDAQERRMNKETARLLLTLL